MNKPVLSSDLARVEIEVERLLADYPELSADPELRADMIEGETSLPEVVQRILRVEREAVALAEGLTDFIMKLEERRGVFKRRQDNARKMIQRVLEIADVKTLRLPEATLSIALTPPKVTVSDPDALPDEFMRVKREPDLAKIKEALQDQKTIPGAYLTNGGQTLKIR